MEVVSIISLIATGITFAVVITTTIIFANKQINMKNEYNSRFNSVTNDINEAQKKNYEYDLNQDGSIKTQGENIRTQSETLNKNLEDSTARLRYTVQSEYVNKAAQESLVNTNMLKAKNISADDIRGKKIFANITTGMDVAGYSGWFGDVNADNANIENVNVSKLKVDNLTTTEDLDVKGRMTVKGNIYANNSTFDTVNGESIIAPEITSDVNFNVGGIMSFDDIGTTGEGLFLQDVSTPLLNTDSIKLGRKDPGAWMQYKDPTSIYGIGQWPNNSMRLYSNKASNSSISLGFVDPANNGYTETVKVTPTNATSKDLNVSGPLRVDGGTWAQNKHSIFGGEVVFRNANGSMTHLNHNNTNQNYIRGNITHVDSQIRANQGILTNALENSGESTFNNRIVVNGGGWDRSFQNKHPSTFRGEFHIENGAGRWGTHFNHRNQAQNYISGDTTIRQGSLNTERVFSSDVRSHSIGRENGDWFRLFGTPNAGTAVYNGMSINDGGGLNVGEWKRVGRGESHADLVNSRGRVIANTGLDATGNSIVKGALRINGDLEVCDTAGGNCRKI